ncbi:MAG: D-alanyl-D-alanine carboxypeptidase family protein [Thermomicrobiales bacterium]
MTLVVLGCLLGALGQAASAQEVPELKVNSAQYIVIDAGTGEVFAQRGANERAAMASLTKVFTAIEAIEAAPGEVVLETSEADLLDANNSLMGFDPGERLRLEELLHGLMLPSGNDAALAIARNLGGQPGDDPDQSVQRFVDRMNQRVADMGLRDTHLMNPHGWGVPDHYTSPHDLATFVMYALRYPRFVELISAETYETAEGFELRNNNRLLTDMDYPDLLGGKTGYDWDAGWCLIEVAERDGNTMISVTFDGVHENGDWYDDNRVLLDYAFEQKAQRASAGGQITGERVSYLDPDAAVIGRVAATGATLGSVPDPAVLGQTVSAPGMGPNPASVPAVVRPPTGGLTTTGGLGGSIVPALAVAVAIIGGQGMKSGMRHREVRRRFTVT